MTQIPSQMQNLVCKKVTDRNHQWLKKEKKKEKAKILSLRLALSWELTKRFMF